MITVNNPCNSMAWGGIPNGGFCRINSTEEYCFKLGYDSGLFFSLDEPEEDPQVMSLSEYGESIAVIDWLEEGFTLVDTSRYNLVVTL